MGISYGFILFIAIAALVISVVTLIYTSVYKKRINEALTDIIDETPKKHKPMMSPLKFLLTMILIMVAVYLLITVIAVMMLKMQTPNEHVYTGNTQCTIQLYSDEDIGNTLLGAYSPEEDIPGYTRNDSYDEDVQGRGNFRFVQYTLNPESERVFPEMIVYIEYTGKATGDVMFTEASCRSEMVMFSGNSNAAYPIDLDDGKGMWLILSGHNYYGRLHITSGIVPEDLVKTDSIDLLRKNMTEWGDYDKEVSLDQEMPE